MRVLRPTTDDEREEWLRGRVLAERVSTVLAKPGSKAREQYARFIRESAAGEPSLDPGAEYRDSDDRKHAIGDALRLYRDKHEVRVVARRLYLDDKRSLACAPSGVDSDLIVLQVHIRKEKDTFDGSVVRGLTADMMRVSWAQMSLTGHRFGIHLDYYRDPQTGEECLYEHELEYDRRRGEELLEAMVAFHERAVGRRAA